jgi:outer membrane protein
MKLTLTNTNLKRSFLLFLISTTHIVVAQKYYTLEECVNLAFKNNITVKQKELNKQTAEADRLQSKLNMLPNLNGQLTHNYNVGFAINPVTNTAQRDVTFRNNNFGVNSSLTLFNGFQKVNTIRQQESTLKANTFDVESTKNNIALSVSNAYMQVLMNGEIAESRRLQMEATTEQLKRQEKLFELGGTSKVKLLQLKAQYSNEESQWITAQTQLEQSYLTLWQLLNVPPDFNNQIEKPDSSSTFLLKDDAPNADKIYTDFISKSPDILAAKQRAKTAEISHNIVAGGRSPSITLSAGVNSFYTTQNQQGVGAPILTPIQIGTDISGNPVFSTVPRYSNTEVVPFSNQFDKNLGKNLGFTVSVPILNGWQVNTNIQKARINQTSSELNQKQVQLDVYKNVNQAYLDYKSALKKFAANQNNYEANKESFLLAETQFNIGALSTSDFILTKTQFLQAETNLVQSKYELLFRRKVLDFYLGRPIY